MYLCNKIVHFSYKGGCGICECTHIEAFKIRVGLGYRWLRVINDKMLFKTGSYNTKKLKNKAV